MAKFTTIGIASNIIILEESNTKALTFTPKSFLFATIELSPPKDSKECKTGKHILSVGAPKFTGTKPSLNVSTARLLSVCLVVSAPQK